MLLDTGRVKHYVALAFSGLSANSSTMKVGYFQLVSFYQVGAHMTDAQDDGSRDPRLANLKQRLDAVKREEEAAAAQPEPAPMGRALQLGVDMAAGVGVGAGVGLVIDSFLLSSPWGLITFLFVGFAAGVRNVIRQAAQFQVQGQAPSDESIKD